MSDIFKPSLGSLLQVLAPPLVWFLHLTTVYAAEALICTAPARATDAMMAWTVALATAAALTALLLTAWTLHRGNAPPVQSLGSSRFLHGVSPPSDPAFACWDRVDDPADYLPAHLRIDSLPASIRYCCFGRHFYGALRTRTARSSRKSRVRNRRCGASGWSTGRVLALRPSRCRPRHG